MVLSALLFGQSVDAAPGGNSENAKLCQKGGWQNLQNSEGIPFSSEEECVASGAHGDGVEAIPSITVSFDLAYGTGPGCNASAMLTGFAPDSSFTYQATWGNPDNEIRGGPVSGTVSTDGSGAGSINANLYLSNGINDIIFTVNGVTSGSVLAVC
jgi:hypothetical protein